MIKITKLSDIKPYINRDEFSIKTDNEHGYISITYHVITESSQFESLYAREARGIKFDLEGNIIARSMPKFFNKGERPEEEKAYNKEQPTIFEKLDGSLIHPLILNNEVRLVTKAGVTETSIRAEKELNLTREQLDKLGGLLQEGYTSLLEYTSPNNRIIVNYNEPRLTLLAVRDTITGEFQDLDYYSDLLDLPTPNIYKEESIEDISKWLGVEGIVLVYKDGYRLKVKTEDYLRKHHALEGLSLEKHALSLALQDKVDDLSGILDQDDFDKFFEYWCNINKEAIELSTKLADLKDSLNSLSRKEVALFIKSNLHPLEQAMFWNIYQNKSSPLRVVKDIIFDNLSKASRREKIFEIITTRWWGL